MSLHHKHSPSKAGRLGACPGSGALCELAEAQGVMQDGGADADLGTMKHARTLPGAPIDDLAPDAQEEILYAVGEMHAWFDGALEVYREIALEVKDVNGAVLTRGTADALAIMPGGVARLKDFKFGRGDLDVAHVRAQLAWYAAGVFQAFPVHRVEARALHVPERQAYEETFSSLAPLVEDIRETVYRASQPDAPRNPSASACRYCGAKLICPEFRAQVVESPLVKAEPAALTGATLPAALELARRLEPWCKAVKDHAKAQLVAGVEVPGWELQRKRVREVTGVGAAWSLLDDTLEQVDFLDACKLSIGALESAFVAAMKRRDAHLSVKDSKEIFNARIAPAVTVTEQVALKQQKG